MSPGNNDAPGAVAHHRDALPRAGQVWASIYEDHPQPTLLLDIPEAANGERTLVAVNRAARDLLGEDQAHKIINGDGAAAHQAIFAAYDQSFIRPGQPPAPFSLNSESGALFRAHFAPLPAIDALHSPWLCLVHPYQRDQDQALQELIGELSALHHERSDLDALGMAVAERLREALNTPAVALLAAEGDRFAPRWHSGDEELSTRLVARLRDAQIPPDQLHHLALEPGATPDVCVLNLGGPPAHGVLSWIAQTPPEARPTTLSLLATALDLLLSTAYIRESYSEERMRLRAVLEYVPSAVLLFDTEGKVVMYNSRAQAMIGHNRWKNLGPDDHPFTMRDLDGNELPEERWPLVRAVREGVGCTNEEYVLDFGEIRRNILMTIAPVVDESGVTRLFLASGTDVTERSARDRRKDEFLSVASHELRSPLTPLSGFVHLARQQAEMGKRVDPEVLRRAESQVHRLRRLVDALLDMSRIETGRLRLLRKPTSLRALLKRIAEPWLNGHEGHRVTLHNADEAIFAVIDPDRIEQVISNLIDNALKHGRKEGNVQVRLHTATAHAIISVRDEGGGMSEEEVEQIFERFYSGAASRTTKSMGLGLYISRQIIEEHGGLIEIDTAPGSPTEVRVLLPLGRDAE
ncbi:PAS domain-containing protein [Lujinxingia vulgaris]|uniref:histidine kinase n=1 Tax=Lujinxingia vulgaris TaxID=2600176 RepID=A0A5C6X5F1_9DELT|nr:ATP-binding protein [Lujinxingia vulgaris]TXD33928.1 PAS domain-containing protein [Lujinxingia vulgaris]